MGRPAKLVDVTCVIDNVWTSRGKMLRGGRMEIPQEEAKTLIRDLKVMQTPDFGDDDERQD